MSISPGRMVSRRQILGTLGGIACLGGGVRGLQYARKPKEIVSNGSHDGTAERSFTLDKRSYVEVGDHAYGEYGYTVYKDSNPQTIQFTDSQIQKDSEIESGIQLNNTINRAILEPGTYRMFSIGFRPTVRMSPFARFRETDHETMRIVNYLDVISLYDTPGEDYRGQRYRVVAPADPTDEGNSETELIGLGPKAPIIPGGSTDPTTFARITKLSERLIEEQVNQIGGVTADRFESIQQRNDRARISLFVFTELPNLFENSGPMTETYSGLLRRVLNDSELASKIPDRRPSYQTGWYAQPAKIESKSSAYVPVGLEFEIDSSEIETIDRSKMVYSPRVNISMTQAKESPPVWKVEADPSDILQQVTQAITGD